MFSGSECGSLFGIIIDVNLQEVLIREVGFG
jgi:hypothetical protein